MCFLLPRFVGLLQCLLAAGAHIVLTTVRACFQNANANAATFARCSTTTGAFQPGVNSDGNVGGLAVGSTLCFSTGKLASQQWYLNDTAGRSNQVITVLFTGGQQGLQTKLQVTCDVDQVQPLFPVSKYNTPVHARTHMHTHTNTRTHTCTHRHTHRQTHTHTHTHMNTRAHTQTRTHAL